MQHEWNCPALFNEQRLERVSRSACVSSAETIITIINAITPTIIGMLIMREREGEGWKGVKDKGKKEKEKVMRKRCSFGKRVCVCCFDKSNHSFIHSINPENSTQFNHNPIPQFFINTHTSLTHIHHSNQQQHMSQSSIKSLPHQSSLFFITQINLFLPSLSLSLFLMWLNESNSLLPNPSHITLHHPSLSLWMNCVECGWLCGGDCHEYQFNS